MWKVCVGSLVSSPRLLGATFTIALGYALIACGGRAAEISGDDRAPIVAVTITPSGAASSANASPPATTPQRPSASKASPAPPASAVAAPPPTPPEIVVPASVASGGARRPFLLLLHGFGGGGAAIAKHVGLPALAETERFSYAAPDGSLDRSKRRHWNTGASCCDFDRIGLDHVAVLRGVIEAARANPAVDPARIYVAGFSNGGFMSERLACDIPGIAGVLDVAGSSPTDVATCKAPAPATVIHVHGDDDPTVRVGGGTVLGRTDVAPHPSAASAVAGWAKRAGCGTSSPAGTLDLEASLPEEETTRSRHQGCSGRYELWTVAGGGHDVASSPTAFARLVTTLLFEGS